MKDNTLIHKTEEINEDINNAMNAMFRSCTASSIAEMSEEDFKLMQMCVKFVNDSNELLKEYAKAMTDMNEKLDKILEKMNSKKD